MTRAVQLRGSSCLLAAAVFLSLAQPAFPKRLPGGGSILLEGAQLVEELLGSHDASRARAEFASFAKAGTVAILAALVGSAGYIETRARGAEEHSDSQAADSAADTDDEVSAAKEHGADACPNGAAGDDREDELCSEYAGFMSGMYEDAFDSLSAGDLISEVISSEAASREAASDAQAVAPSAASFDTEEHAAASDCPVTGALAVLLAEYDVSVGADACEPEEQQEAQLETALLREYIEAMGDDYSEVMDGEYNGLMGKMARDGPLVSA